MNAVTLLNELAQQDIRLWLDGEQLRYSAPDGAMTPEVIQLLRQHKPAIIQFLQQSENQQTTIPSADYSKPLPVSSAQQRLWLVQQLEPNSHALHIHTALAIKGNLNQAYLEQACFAIIQRHAILRTSYYQENGKLYQKIHEQLDWQLVEQVIAPDALEAAIQQERNQAFDLGHVPPLRCTLFKLAEQDFVLSFTVHHIAADGWSLGIFVQELVQHYQALLENKNSNVAKLERQYADFATWQISEQRQNQLKQQLDFWQKELAGVPNLSLPSSVARQTNHDNTANVLQWTIDGSAVQALNKQFGSTLFATMTTLFSILLQRYSLQHDFCIGTPVAGRSASALEPLIGCFINVLAIRCELDNTLRFSDYLLASKARCNQALAMQDVPFEQVVQSLQLPRDLSITPIFQTMISVQNTPFTYQALSGLSINELVIANAEAQFDLKLTVREDGEQIDLAFEYKKALFDPIFIQRMSAHFTALISDACSHPNKPLAELTLYPASHLSQQLSLGKQGFNDTQVALADTPIFPLAFQQQAQQTPDAIAVRNQDSQLSYQQLNQRANQLAHYLIEHGAKPGLFIGVCMQRSLDLMVSLLAVLKTGAAYLPLDPDLPENRLHFMLDDSQAQLVLCQQALQNVLPSNQTILAIEQFDGQAYSSDNPECSIATNDLAYVLYTSGSTGNPKGVLIEHLGLYNYLDYAKQHYLSDIDASIVSSTINFDATITTLFTPLLCGKTVILTAANDEDFQQLATFIFNDTHNYLFKITPAHLELLASQHANAATQQAHYFILGGEQLLTSQVSKWLNQLTPNAQFANEYGPTETVVGCCVLSFNQRDYHYASNAAVPIGKPIQNTHLFVLDESGNPVPQGIPGELYIANLGVARGYLNLDDKSQHNFLANRFSADSYARMYRTGDLVRQLPNGDLQYLGRIDQQVKLRGQRIELSEIEHFIQQFPGIQTCVADIRLHNEDKRLVAWYSANHAIDEDALKRLISQQLPNCMHPAAIVQVNEWPFSVNGKISRNKLPNPDWNQINRHEFIAPQTETQLRLAAIWQQVLGLESIGITDNFFEIGGHSLTAAEALAIAQQTFKVDLPLRKLFETPTIQAIASLLDDALIAQKILEQTVTADDEESESFIL